MQDEENKNELTPSLANVLDRVDVSEIVTQEEVSEQCMALVNATAKKGYTELTLTQDIEFDPMEDVAKVDATLNFAVEGLAKLSTRNLTSKTTKTILSKDGGLEEIPLTDVELAQAERIRAQTIKDYSGIIQDCLREKRKLACQLYGHQGMAPSYSTKTSHERKVSGSAHTLKNSGSGLLGQTAKEIKKIPSTQ